MAQEALPHPTPPGRGMASYPISHETRGGGEGYMDEAGIVWDLTMKAIIGSGESLPMIPRIIADDS